MTTRPNADIAGATTAHTRLRARLAEQAGHDPTGAWVTRPCRLPGWTVGHLLTHLARNADSHVRMLEAAAGGDAVAQYDGGRPARQAGIDDGAARPASELVEDVLASAARLERTWASLPDESWEGHGVRGDGTLWPCVVLPFHRWREVEVHSVDLGIGASWSDWPDEYVERELPRALATLPARLADAAARRRLTAWLLDRARSPGDLVVSGWEEQAYSAGR